MKRLFLLFMTLAAIFPCSVFADDEGKDWEITNYAVKETGICMGMASEQIKANATLLLYSNSSVEVARETLLKNLRIGIDQKTTVYSGTMTINKWEGHRYIAGDDNSVYAHLAVIIPSGGKRVLIADLAVPVGSLGARVNWEKLRRTWMYNYNQWVSKMAQRR